MPTFISDDAKALLKAMLTVDPLERITIPEIRYAAVEGFA